MTSDAPKVGTPRTLRPLIAALLEAGFAERGWTKQGRGVRSFQRPAGDGPLVVQWLPALEADNYGGMRLGGVGGLRYPAVEEAVVSFGLDALPESAVTWAYRGDIAGVFELAVTTAGALVDPEGGYFDWRIDGPARIPSAVEEFFAMIDGPLSAWVDERHPVERLLDRAVAHPEEFRTGGTSARALAVLALQEGCPEAARTVVRHVRTINADQVARLARFEQLLAQRYPGYGGPQRTGEIA